MKQIGLPWEKTQSHLKRGETYAPSDNFYSVARQALRTNACPEEKGKKRKDAEGQKRKCEPDSDSPWTFDGGGGPAVTTYKKEPSQSGSPQRDKGRKVNGNL